MKLRGFQRLFNHERIDISHAYSRKSVRCYFTFPNLNKKVKFPYILANVLTKTGKQIVLSVYLFTNSDFDFYLAKRLIVWQYLYSRGKFVLKASNWSRSIKKTSK